MNIKKKKCKKKEKQKLHKAYLSTLFIMESWIHN